MLLVILRNIIKEDCFLCGWRDGQLSGFGSEMTLEYLENHYKQTWLLFLFFGSLPVVECDTVNMTSEAYSLSKL